MVIAVDFQRGACPIGAQPPNTVRGRVYHHEACGYQGDLPVHTLCRVRTEECLPARPAVASAWRHRRFRRTIPVEFHTCSRVPVLLGCGQPTPTALPDIYTPISERIVRSSVRDPLNSQIYLLKRPTSLFCPAAKRTNFPAAYSVETVVNIW